MPERSDGSPPREPDKVVSLDSYRQRRLSGSALNQTASTGFEVYAHLYIDLCSDGETRFGIVGASEDNALSMLEPIFILGRQLMHLATS